MEAMRKMGMIALVIVGSIGFLIFIIYATVKTKSVDLHDYEPFKEWIGQTVTLKKPTVLFNDHMQTHENSDYPYVLLDSLHPHWIYLDHYTYTGDMEEIATFEAGTFLKLEKAVQYTNGVSGFSNPTIFGTIKTSGGNYKIAYRWGTMDIGKRYDKDVACWKFHQAPWQDHADTTLYDLPEARFW